MSDTKKCTKCFVDLPKKEFPKEESRKDGLYPWCKKCLSNHRKERYKKRTRKIHLTHKVCSLCKEDKPREAYKVYSGGNLHYRCISCEEKEEALKQSGNILCTSCNIEKPKKDFVPSRQDCLRAECKECAKKYNKSSFAKRKNSQLQKIYGISLDQYNELLKKQDYKCAVCKRPHTDFKNSLAVDHAHGGPQAGAIRGLLCDTCNRFVVWKHNTSELLRNAAEYLDRDYTGYFVPEKYLHGPKKRRKKRKRVE